MSKDTFGDRLKSEREDRGLSIQAVAEILGVDQDLLRALERNDFAALPEEAAMKECLHGYAECLDVDAELMIADYDQERAGHVGRVVDAGAKRAGEAVPTPTAAAAEPGPRPLRWLLTATIGLAVALLVWWAVSRNATEPQQGSAMTAVPVEREAAGATVEPPTALDTIAPADDALPPTAVVPPPADPAPPPATPAPAPIERSPAPPVSPSPAVSVLTVTDHGVGTAVEGHQLVGRSDRFAEGMSAWFWTRVRGGSSGDQVVHVWLRDGREAMRRSLEIGGSNWRTYSAMTLSTCTAGSWAVEAHDGAGRVLARSEFVCVP